MKKLIKPNGINLFLLLIAIIKWSVFLESSLLLFLACLDQTLHQEKSCLADV